MKEKRPGSVLGNKYEVVRTIGASSAEHIYEVRRAGKSGMETLVEERLVARVIQKGLANWEGFERRVINSARAWSAINHPNVMRILDSGGAREVVFTIYELLDGRDLEAVLSEKNRLEWKEARPIFLDACSALSALHQGGIVHKDIAPDQLFLVEGPRWMGTKLLASDWIQTQKIPPPCRNDCVVGRAQYLSPEQAKAAFGLIEKQPLSGMVDIFALGVVLHRTLTGQRVFDGENDIEVLASRLQAPPKAPSERLPGLSPEVDALVMKALQIDPAARYQSAAEFRAAMEDVRE